MLHDAVADGDGGGGGEQPGAVVVATRWEGEKLWAPPNLTPRLPLKEAGHRRWVCVLGMSGVWRDGGCGCSSHPGALMATDEVEGLGWRGGDGKAGDGWV